LITARGALGVDPFWVVAYLFIVSAKLGLS
jgi:hypothetical protein